MGLEAVVEMQKKLHICRGLCKPKFLPEKSSSQAYLSSQSADRPCQKHCIMSVKLHDANGINNTYVPETTYYHFW